MSKDAKILIVEDDRDLSSIMARFLASEGFRASVVDSAEGAYVELTKDGFDAIVLDINLPGDDGIALCRELRRTSSTPVIFASARAGDEARALALEGGGDAYLSKPFSLRELLAQIKAVLRRSDRSASAFDASRLVLDQAARRIFKDGKLVELAPKEFELAALLMRNPSEALSHKRLMADVWGAFSDAEQQTLAVHMRWIRSKIEDDPSHPVYFETVRGYGYRFNPNVPEVGLGGDD